MSFNPMKTEDKMNLEYSESFLKPKLKFCIYKQKLNYTKHRAHFLTIGARNIIIIVAYESKMHLK